MYAGVMGSKRPPSPGPALEAPNLGCPFLSQAMEGLAAPHSPAPEPVFASSTGGQQLGEGQGGGGTVGIQMEF